LDFELKTTPVAPMIANKIPIKSLKRNFSFNKIGARMAFETSVVVPKGAIVEAGANPYAFIKEIRI
jgi:hypothetical protein